MGSLLINETNKNWNVKFAGGNEESIASLLSSRKLKLIVLDKIRAWWFNSNWMFFMPDIRKNAPGERNTMNEMKSDEWASARVEKGDSEMEAPTFTSRSSSARSDNSTELLLDCCWLLLVETCSSDWIYWVIEWIEDTWLKLAGQAQPIDLLCPTSAK